MNLKKVKDTRPLGDTPLTSGPLAQILLRAVAEEYIAWYQYSVIAPFLVGEFRTEVQDEFYQHAVEELEHASKLLERINQLGIQPTGLILGPENWNAMASANYKVPGSTSTQHNLAINVEAEITAIHTYKELVIIAEEEGDIVTAELAKSILADEEIHLSELSDFLNDISSKQLN